MLSVPSLGPTDALLTRVLGLRPVREHPNPADVRGLVHVYEMGPGGPGAELHVVVEPDRPPARQGAAACITWPSEHQRTKTTPPGWSD